LGSYIGILLVADLDAAFDAALITFDEVEKPVFGKRLSAEGEAALATRFGDRIVSFTDRHQRYLQRHRARFAAAESSHSRGSAPIAKSVEQ
jgi:hypothetical protein